MVYIEKGRKEEERKKRKTIKEKKTCVESSVLWALSSSKEKEGICENRENMAEGMIHEKVF